MSDDQTVGKAIKMELPPFAALKAFDAVGRAGGIRRAAILLGIDHTVVSRHLRQLESWVGTALYDRRAANGLTEDGKRYHARVSAALHDLADATREIMKKDVDSVLRVSAVPGFGVSWLVSKLVKFHRLHPTVEIVFHPRDHMPDLMRQEADVDIRWVTDDAALETSKSLRTLELDRPPGFAVASPTYLARMPVQTLEDLTQANLIHEENTLQWHNWFAAHGIETPTKLAGPLMWHANATLEAARNGEGVALTNKYIVRDDLDTGRLVTVGPPEALGFPITRGGYVFSSLETRWQKGPAAQFRRWLVAEMRASDSQNARPGLRAIQTA